MTTEEKVTKVQSIYDGLMNKISDLCQQAKEELKQLKGGKEE